VGLLKRHFAEKESSATASDIVIGSTVLIVVVPVRDHTGDLRWRFANLREADDVETLPHSLMQKDAEPLAAFVELQLSAIWALGWSQGAVITLKEYADVHG
jgi:hypothetical protein